LIDVDVSASTAAFVGTVEHQSGEKPDADTKDKEDHPETNPTALR